MQQTLTYYLGDSLQVNWWYITDWLIYNRASLKINSQKQTYLWDPDTDN